ncbi:TIGR00341 family protein [Sinomicrobium weinanense]|uniref:TIGR00341 family protein n=1 Tax=Sinomicrobium weinanense TaxID=2842200 RepID=A0A926JVT7_9FLAO|nr:TIGR00341 family protein [Sinomicrobium weinanense]MBC9798301.1 TIGR00341 family protein [Sinomicrobium weinanense]MBU3124544.1 TIGR00341 family protein [Sinomicrobium weinanense]
MQEKENPTGPSRPEGTEGKENDSKEKVKKDFSGLLGSLKTFFGELLDIRSNTDQETTIEHIKADIPFKGHNSWILICSIFIASVGLNANSTAVVIGAMLISPLMGPILGMGMSIAINDVDTLRRSIKNFLVMVGLSIITAFLFFKLFPLRDESSELLARTAPDIRDVLIAFFGGLALVIARAKKGTIASVIFGVAIATALMPPLCTVGFGLAIGNWDYARGAMYLFLINTIFIGLATFLVLKILRFPMVRYVNSARRRTIARVASLIAIIVMIPAGYTFFKVWKESTFKNEARKFIHTVVAPYQFSKGGMFVENLSDINYRSEGESSIELVFMGDEAIPENVINTWENQKQTEYPALKDAKLKIVQGGQSDAEQRFRYVNELYESNKRELVNNEEKIRFLEEEVERLQKLTSNVDFNKISSEAKILYESVGEFGFSNEIRTDFAKTDTIPAFTVKWKEATSQTERNKELEKMKNWLQLKTGNDKIEIKQLN